MQTAVAVIDATATRTEKFSLFPPFAFCNNHELLPMIKRCSCTRFIHEFVVIKKNELSSLIQNKISRQIVLFAQIFRILVNIFTDGQP